MKLKNSLKNQKNAMIIFYQKLKNNMNITQIKTKKEKMKMIPMMMKMTIIYQTIIYPMKKN